QARIGYAAGVAAAVVDLARGDGRVAGGVELDGDVLGDHHRQDGIDHGHGGGAGGAVAVVVRHGQGDAVGADVGAIKIGLTQAQAGYSAGVAASVVDLGRGNRPVAGGIQLKCEVLADGHRRDGIDHGHGGGGGGAVAVVVGDRQGHGV